MPAFDRNRPLSDAEVAPARQIGESPCLISAAHAARGPRPSRRGRLALVIGLVATLASVAGVAGASGPDNTSLSFVTVSPAFKVATNLSVGSDATLSRVVIGGSTKVPTDATAVRLNITVKGTKAGTLSIYPASNPSGGSGQSLTWAAGGSATGTVMENVGAADSVSFHNASTAAATLTATLTGYSTQVTASDINGVGGSSGQVLTNTGTGGAVWGAAGAPAYASGRGFYSVTTTLTALQTLTVPSGSYWMSVTANPDNAVAADHIECGLYPPAGNGVGFGYADTVASTYGESMALQALVTTTGGTYSLKCADTQGSGHLYEVAMIAMRVGSANGAVNVNAGSNLGGTGARN